MAVPVLTAASQAGVIAAPQAPAVAPPPGAASAPPVPRLMPPGSPPAASVLQYSADGLISVSPAGDVTAADNVVVKYADVTLSADRLEGNFNRELVFSGHARLETRGATSYADSIHVIPRTRRYVLINPRAVLQPEFLQNRILAPLFLNGGELSGTETGYADARQSVATTCIERYHHYELRVREAEVIPLHRITLRNTAVYFFGVKLVTVPIIVIPLDLRARRRPRSDYLPEFGQNFDEGYYARFPYTFPEGDIAATFLRLDVTQKRGEGYRVAQEYLAGKQTSAFDTSAPTGGFTGATSGTIAQAYGYGTTGRLPRLGTGLGPQNGGLFAVQGYFADGFDRNFNGSFRHQQGIGGNNRFGFSTELQRNSFYVGSGQSSQTTRFDLAHNDPAHGSNADLSVNLNTNSTTGTTASDSQQLTATLHHSLDFANSGSNHNMLSYDLNLSGFRNSSAAIGSHNVQLDSLFQFQHSARDFSYSLQANKSFDIASSQQNGFAGTIEKLPEFLLSADTANFKGGWLRTVPAHLDFGIGRYSEPGHDMTDDRVLLGLQVPEFSLLRGRTEIVTAGGFEQRLYGDGAAEYILRNTTRLRQRLGGRSGFDISYRYEQPEGGTPFLFDAFGKTHNISAEAGYLDDTHFQATARVGYDLLGTPAGVTPRPFQTLSTRLMWRPNPRLRFDTLASFDPNTSRFIDITNSIRLRAKNDMGADIVGRYDPQLHKFSQISSQFDIPIGHVWRVAGAIQYNGALGVFESRNVQLTREWDCMEASLTYSDNPLSFRGGSNRQIFLSIRIKAFPGDRWVPRGPAGEAVGTGIGDIF